MDERTRRELALTRKLYLVWAALGLLFVLTLCYIIVLGMRTRQLSAAEIGPVDDFPPNSVTLKYINAQFFDGETQKNLTTLPLQVVRDDSGNFTIFFARSTQPVFGSLIPRQCVVNWVDNGEVQRFEEPCGGSRWTRDGKYQDGPAPRDLDRFPVDIANGKVSIELRLIEGPATP